MSTLLSTHSLQIIILEDLVVGLILLNLANQFRDCARVFEALAAFRFESPLLVFKVFLQFIMVFQCTLKYCSVAKWGYLHYQPSIPGNALFLSIFSVLLVAQIYLGFKYRTYGVSIAFCMGLCMEVIGYIGRLLMHGDPFWKPWFLMYLIDLTIGPTLIAAGIYLCLARIVVVYDGDGGRVARWRPRSYTLFFLGWDFLSLLLQAIGGAIASLAILQSKITLGTNIMVAGLAVQVASLLFFILLCSDLAWRVDIHKGRLNPKHEALHNSRIFKLFLCALALATFGIFIRSVFRVAELSQGFKGKLANNQISFMILDGTMVIIAMFSLTVMHPGLGFGSVWQEANFYLLSRRGKGERDMGLHSSTESENTGKEGVDMIGTREMGV